ncbi:sigma factor [Pseudarthrobacter sulfonivorans]|nr:sigma factor [Pseudarthrobacter sulfonivorans]
MSATPLPRAANAAVETVDVSRTESQMQLNTISMEQMTSSINEVARYVGSRLARAGRACDFDDALQDIRIAVWRGVDDGHYRQIPGVRFGAWVQGIAAHVCSAYTSKARSRESLPLLIDPGDNDEGNVVSPHEIFGPEDVAEREWAVSILQTTRHYVGDAVWGAAMSLLLADDSRTPGSSKDRRSYRQLVFVRQMAITVRQALAAVDAEGRDIGDEASFAARCLPTPLQQQIAQRVVRLELRREERSDVIAAIASDFGVSRRYVEVQIGRVRRLYAAAAEISSPLVHLRTVAHLRNV